jgi:hypothetical protein
MEIYKLPCYNGTTSLGTRIGRAHIQDSINMDNNPRENLDDNHPLEPDEDDLMAVQLDSLETFFGQLSARTVDEE